jgi:parallel beta-helix repeat protein
MLKMQLTGFRGEGLFRTTVSTIILVLLLASMFAIAFNIPQVKASGIIYVRADGSIDPPTASISAIDNVTYTFTGDINGSIVVERDNIVVDGLGYTLDGLGSKSGYTWNVVFVNGIDLAGRSNVTVKNIKIRAFECAVFLADSLNNSILANNIVSNLGGIAVHNSSYNSIVENALADNEVGMHIMDFSNSNVVSRNNITRAGGEGLTLGNYCSNNSLYENSISNSNWGFGLGFFCSNNTLYRNNVTDNEQSGIYITRSPNNILRMNSVKTTTHQYAFHVEASSEWSCADSFNDVDASNTVNGKPIYYWVNRHNVEVPSDAGFVALVNCSEIDVKNLSQPEELEMFSTNESLITGNEIAYTWNAMTFRNCFNNDIVGNNVTGTVNGVWFDNSSQNNICRNNVLSNRIGVSLTWGSSNNIVSNNVFMGNQEDGIGLLAFPTNNSIFGNTIKGNGKGIETYNVSSSNAVFNNNITDNGEAGLWLERTSGICIYHNNFSNNTRQIFSNDSTCVWDDGYPSGGNYWSDYNGTDQYAGSNQNQIGADGIGDIPYMLDANNTDRYPLMTPWIQLPGDANSDGIVDIYDAIILANAFNSELGDSNWNSVADINGDNTVDIYDAITLANNYGKTA